MGIYGFVIADSFVVLGFAWAVAKVVGWAGLCRRCELYVVARGVDADEGTA